MTNTGSCRTEAIYSDAILTFVTEVLKLVCELFQRSKVNEKEFEEALMAALQFFPEVKLKDEQKKY